MSVTRHKLIQSLALYQHVKSDEKMMMGMSLAYSLFNPIEVKEALQDFNNFEQQVAALPTPEKPIMMTPPPQEKHALDPTGKNLLPLETALQPYIPPQDTTAQENEFNFDLMEILDEVNDEQMVLAANQRTTQQHEESMQRSVSTKTAVSRKEIHLKCPWHHLHIAKLGQLVP